MVEQVKTMRAYPTAPTKDCLAVLDALAARLKDHRTLPVVDEDRTTFSSVVARAVLDPVKSLVAQVEAQHKAIQSLAKTVESVKNAPLLSTLSPPASSAPHAPSNTSYAKTASTTPVSPRASYAPLPRDAGERVLVRFTGPPPPIFHLPYRELVEKLNELLVPMGLPEILFAQKQIKGVQGLYVAPATGKEGAEELTRRWNEWGPSLLPGGRVVPVVVHCFLQINGIPFAALGSMDEAARELERKNAELGLVRGTPRFVNPPPSAAKISAMRAAGRKPPSAGSIVFQLESKEKVDMAVAAGRVMFGGQAPQVQRAFPHLEVVQCWGCYRYGHVRSRCPETVAKCGGCGGASHGAVCSAVPACVNCGGVHRADNPACPKRKELAARMRQRVNELCATLDATSSHHRSPLPAEPSLSPLPLSISLLSFPQHTQPSALRLPGSL
ncbi:hypothetical protein C8F04DRAFT_1255906 [Mycena alexandri]|uniref:CCHC-type domain-containing protein n=1 Tax=Mycena alexandri TaxID=1745969 RepID=A0AAD6T537_9AGAR|nr:hypothetical protein C8F04DRAFT_1255906 [Mycena alexandri]